MLSYLMQRKRHAMVSPTVRRQVCRILLVRITAVLFHDVKVVASSQVADMKAEVTKLKDELAPVYKDKARLSEELMQCRESLGRVRDINEKHSKALDEATGRIRDLQSRNKELSQQVDHERATQAVAASELEVLCDC